MPVLKDDNQVDAKSNLKTKAKSNSNLNLNLKLKFSQTYVPCVSSYVNYADLPVFLINYVVFMKYKVPCTKYEV